MDCYDSFLAMAVLDGRLGNTRMALRCNVGLGNENLNSIGRGECGIYIPLFGTRWSDGFG